MADEPIPPAPKAALPARSSEFDAYRHPDDASFDKFVAALDRAYHRPLQMIWRSFLQGIATALGATVGAGLVFIILFYALHHLDIGPYAQQIQNIIIPQSIRNELDQSAATSSQVNAILQEASPSPTATK